MWIIAFTALAVVTMLAGGVNLSQVVALEQHDGLRAPEAWVPLIGPFAGWMVARLSPRSPIAWLLLAISADAALFGSAALVTLSRPDLPQVLLDAAGWLTTWVFLPSYYAIFMLLPLLYPDGRLPSPRWRPVLLAMTLLIVGESLLLAVGTRETINPAVDNVWYWDASRQFLDAVAPVIWVSMPVLAVLGLAAPAACSGSSCCTAGSTPCSPTSSCPPSSPQPRRSSRSCRGCSPSSCSVATGRRP